jgi:hypothetical protein
MERVTLSGDGKVSGLSLLHPMRNPNSTNAELPGSSTIVFTGSFGKR